MRTSFNRMCSAHAALFLAACALFFTNCTPSLPEISIEDQEAVLSPVLIGSCSIFMNIRNTGSGGDAVVAARTSIAGAILELHDTIDGRMVKTERIHIPAKSLVELAPASAHFMVFRIPRDMKADDRFNLYILFEKAGERMVPLQLTTVETKRTGARYR